MPQRERRKLLNSNSMKKMDYVLHAADKDMVVHLTIYFWLAVPTNACFSKVGPGSTISRSL